MVPSGEIHTRLTEATHRFFILRLILYLRETWRLYFRQKVDFSLRDLMSWFPAWQASLRDHVTPLGDERPWLTYGAIRFLEQTVTRDMRVFEFGAGGSSLFFAQRVSYGFSVEHDPRWQSAVQAQLKTRGLSNWTVDLIEPSANRAGGRSPANPDDYVSSDDSHLGKTYYAYASSIDRHPDESFDIVLVDGRARPSCFKHALPKVRVGGYLILDDACRPHYACVQATLDKPGWRKQEFNGPAPGTFGFKQTFVWTRQV